MAGFVGPAKTYADHRISLSWEPPVESPACEMNHQRGLRGWAGGVFWIVLAEAVKSPLTRHDFFLAAASQ